MAENFEIHMKQDDTGPPVRVHVVNDSNGQAPDLTGAVVTFKLLRIDSEGETIVVFEKAASVENPPASSGILRYDWGTGDTTLVGRFMSLFRVVFQDATIEHYPAQGFIWVSIEQDGAT